MSSIFLVRTKPFDGECLTSYIQRVAEINFITSNDIWKLLKIGELHYPQVPSSYLIDIMPALVIDIRKLEKMLLLDEFYLDKLTFNNTINKFFSIDTDTGKIQVMNKFFSKYRRFCPICVSEKLFFKLIWQVEEIEECNIHNIKLICKCMKCNRMIPSMPSRGGIGICPYCQNFIVKSSKIDNFSNINERIYTDWVYLIEENKKICKTRDDFSLLQELAIRMLYITRNSKVVPNRRMLLNLAKGKKVMYIHLCIKLVIDVLRCTGISIESLITCTPTIKFINEIIYNQILTLDEINENPYLNILI